MLIVTEAWRDDTGAVGAVAVAVAFARALEAVAAARMVAIKRSNRWSVIFPSLLVCC